MFLPVFLSKGVKMKKSFFALALFLILLSCPAFAAWYFDADSVTVDLTITSSLSIERQGSAELDYVTSEVTFIPKNTESQSVLSIVAIPKPDSVKEGDYVFRWESPVPADPGFDINARVKTRNTFDEVKKISFPYTGFPSDIEHYTEPSENIDSNHSKIIDQASELAAGESDYYKVVFKMADWTKDAVKYDLSTINTKATHKASWVLAKKDGVCDEITTLFIALLRAVGIPARFVAGVAYTESPEFPKKWGAHGWAEVYFPGTGWVPFDVTYGEYGYVDPTHIKMKEAFDSAESDMRHEWLGHGVQVSANPIVVSAELVKHEGTTKDNVKIAVDAVQNDVGIGSYDLVEVTVTNTRDSYVATTIYIAKIAELEMEKSSQAIMLMPLETRKFYWLVKVLDSLDPHYTYTFPITVADMRNTSAESAFYVLPGATVFSKEEMESVMNAAEKEAEKIYSKKLELNCSQKKGFYYVYDDPELECSVKNTGNFPFKGLSFCFKDECQQADLAISQEKFFPYTLHSPKPGINKVQFTIEGTDVAKSFFYDLDVMDEPKVSIDELEYPSQLEFDKPYDVVFTIKKSSASVPINLTMKFDAAGMEKSVEIPALNVDKKFQFNLDSTDLSMKPNIFIVSVDSSDQNGKLYTQKEQFEIKLVNVTFSQKLVIWLHDLDRWLRGLFD
jgi:transglutaminase-like putative cysteine protease